MERYPPGLFRFAVDRHLDAMLMVHVERMRIVYANDGACRALGYRREELIDQPPSIVFADKTVDRLDHEYRRLNGSEDGVEIERAVFRRKDGSTFPVEISREALTGQEGTFVLGVARDITARLDAERAIREGELRLKLAMEASGLALFDWDLRSNLVHLGAEWLAMLGGAHEASVTPIQKLQLLVHPDDLPGLLAQVQRVVSGETALYRVEHRVRCVDGQWKWIESTARVSERDAAGHALRITGTNADVTERRALAELKNAFVANVTHELRTPLAGILASLELLKSGTLGAIGNEAQRFVDMAHANGERLSSLIDDLLDLERIESGRMRLEIERVELAPALEQAASLNAAYAARHKARVRVVAPAASLAVSADAKRLLQVLTNLLSNAAKYSPEGGEIEVRLEPRGERVTIAVADQGPGVPEDFRARLFGKFEQADGAKPGTGLGLAICKSLVERMGGRIRYEHGPGAVFCVELPCA